MSESGAKKSRQRATAPPALQMNAKVILRASDAVMALDISDVKVRNRTAQIIVGLCRAAFAQSKVIAILARAGLHAETGPNSRLVDEISMRLMWLHGLTAAERASVVDTMIAKDIDETRRTLTYLEETGHPLEFDVAEMDTFDLDAISKGDLHQQTTRLLAAVKASQVEPWSSYAMWREDTKLSHPSVTLSGGYAQANEDGFLQSSEPRRMDFELEAHRATQIIVANLTSAILADEGLPEAQASRFAVAVMSP